MVTVFAPVNIAWIKYMGKNGVLPTNSSFSMTLSGLGTTTAISLSDPDAPLSITFEGSPYVPPETGRKKAERFLLALSPFRALLEEAGIPVRVTRGCYSIHTWNSVPAGTGIATSASGFAALTLAWFGVLAGNRLSEFRARYESDADFRSRVARVSALGSGSACRSFHGPFVEWKNSGEVVPFPSAESGVVDRFVDFVLILESHSKQVSSSEAHGRVRSSPRFAGRPERAGHRLDLVKQALLARDGKALSRIVLEEAVDMHELFHTSVPPFRYQNPDSEEWIRRVRENDPGLPSQNAILTLDAGANVHVFVPAAEQRIWGRYFQGLGVRFECSGAGEGARFVDTGQ
jgi:diphosphomevalonate decarboxylase